MKRFVFIITLLFISQSLSIAAPDGKAKQTVLKKSNARPVTSKVKEKPTSDPFDKTSVEEMARQCVTLQTDAGAIEIEMLAEAAPNTVRNFLNLAATQSFDGTTFHRTVKDFVIQGGDLSTRGSLNTQLAERAARRLADEPNYVKHLRGVVSMARGDEPNSAATSFFILVGDAAHLDNKFAAFGRVRGGMDVADAISTRPADGETPRAPARLTKATIATCAVVDATKTQ